MNKEIEEMANELVKICPIFKDDVCNGTPCYNCVANKLYNAGYRKQVWHKVADGDFPKVDEMVWVVGKRTKNTYCYDVGYMKECKQFYGRDIDGEYDFNTKIIAWTELPKYEGEKK